MRLQIVTAHKNDADAFREQTAMIKKSGAQFDPEQRVWWHDTEQMTAPDLRWLFEAARCYGTYVNPLT